ncbi:MAG: TatD family hydrolase [Candidatus Eisenbacteria sp.]|nr:TatD family hydrolase [Candidatus Eisenbacteria bacterium]
MIDTHAHLHFPDFDADRAAVISRAFAFGITGIVEISVAPGAWAEVLRLAQADPRIFAALGVHPHEAAAATPGALRRMERRLADPGVVAVGETGLDRVRGFSSHEDQRRALIAQIGIARESGLPLVIHCREAFDELIPLLAREGGAAIRGVFHCFSGGVAEAQAVTARGFLVGLGGAVTYAPERWRPVLAALPREAILLETDAPFLRPAPDRRGRNEPALLLRTAEAIAPDLGMTCSELVALADANARRFFGLSAPGAAVESAADGDVAAERSASGSAAPDSPERS